MINLNRRKYDYSEYPPEFSDEFRKYIRTRDGYLCSICNADNKLLDVHHIDYIKKNTTKMNCISLCRDCHQMIHLSVWARRMIWKHKLWDVVRKREMFQYAASR